MEERPLIACDLMRGTEITRVVVKYWISNSKANEKSETVRSVQRIDSRIRITELAGCDQVNGAPVNTFCCINNSVLI